MNTLKKKASKKMTDTLTLDFGKITSTRQHKKQSVWGKKKQALVGFNKGLAVKSR